MVKKVSIMVSVLTTTKVLEKSPASNLIKKEFKFKDGSKRKKVTTVT